MVLLSDKYIDPLLVSTDGTLRDNIQESLWEGNLYPIDKLPEPILGNPDRTMWKINA